ncbi:Protein ENHANCED DISEASE RESISTANCE 2-like [Linum perenne]
MEEENKEQELWVERLKSGGSVPLLDPESCSSGWASPPGNKFMVRGPDYLTTKVKIPAGEYLLKPIGFDWIKGPTKVAQVLKDPNSRVRKAIDEVGGSHNDDKPFIWAFNLQVPSKENYSAVAYFAAIDPIVEGSLMDRFVKGDDGFRNSRLKLIANIVKGPWIVRKAVGEQAVCLIGRALSCKYCIGERFIEVDVDIGSSVVANAIVHLAYGYIKLLTVDLGFVIEGLTESELPEKLLGAFRFSELDPGSATMLKQTPAPSDLNGQQRGVLNGQSSLPKRLWKSIGQGFLSTSSSSSSSSG